ncbi:hypothetical protein ACOCJ7_06570 [Knoellia sp. CPCC 206453]|uniref:hypothetical protein n=1 Tax=Knoellia pratensis TaxID=3404796 RepID=UPI003623F704
MELDTAFATLKAATASMVEALREANLTELSREQLVSVVEAVHRTSNTMAGVQTVAVAHLAAVEDKRRCARCLGRAAPRVGSPVVGCARAERAGVGDQCAGSFDVGRVGGAPSEQDPAPGGGDVVG